MVVTGRVTAATVSCEIHCLGYFTNSEIQGVRLMNAIWVGATQNLSCLCSQV
jgi:hypothetical protein